MNNNSLMQKQDTAKSLLKISSALPQHDRDTVLKRARMTTHRTNTSLAHTTSFSVDSRTWKGNIENLIGASQIPLGIAGPILINGDYAKGQFYVPLATTEGALVMTYHRGMVVLTKAGGARVKIIRDESHISPAFKVSNIDESEDLIIWIKENFSSIKQEAEQTTKHGVLLRIECAYIGRWVITKFVYSTGDAQGLNMINCATDAACSFIEKEKNKSYILRSNYSSVKKPSFLNIFNGYGKSVFAECIIPRRVLRLAQTTPEKMEEYCKISMYASLNAGMLGSNGHTANGIAAIYIACGQDVADVSVSHLSYAKCEINESGDLYTCVHLPNLLLGTIGGGTGIGTQVECLKIMDCAGSNKVQKFAEIVAATALAGEIAVVAALTNGTYVKAHEHYGRNKPTIKL